MFTLFEWLGIDATEATETEVAKFPTFSLAWLAAAILARDKWGTECDIGQLNEVNDLKTQEWVGYVGLEIRVVESG